MTPAVAATKTWDGGGANDLWQTGGNWNADTAPLANDALVFGGTVRLNPSNDFTGGIAFNGISFPAGAGSFTVSGNAVTLTRPIAGAGTALVNGNITNTSTNGQTILVPITLSSGNYTVATAAAGGVLNLNGVVARSSGTTVVFSKGAGNINTVGSGLANNAGGILGGWAVIGNDWASVDGSGNVVPYTGYTAISNGAVTSGANLNYRYTADTADITAANGTVINSFLATLTTNTPAVTNRTLTIETGGVMKIASGGGIYRTGNSVGGVMTFAGGSLTVDGGGELNLLDATTSAANFAATNNNLAISSVIANDGANAVSVNILGYLNISAANTYTGGTFINQGRVQAGNAAALGTGPIVVYPGGELFTNSGGTWPYAITLSGLGPNETANGTNGPGAMRVGNTPTLTGQITLAGNTRISSSNATGGTISGKITGTGPLEIIPFASNGVLNLSNANASAPNDWTGDLRLAALTGSTLRTLIVRIGADEQIPNTSNLTIASAEPFAAGSIATFDLNGRNETIGGLIGTANVNNRVTNTGAVASILTMGSTNTNATFGGVIQDAGTGGLSLVKVGTGKQILAGINTNIGSTTVSGGTLEVNGTLSGTGATVGNGATLTGSGTISGSVTIGNGGTLAGGSNEAGVLTMNGPLVVGSGPGDTAHIRVGAGAGTIAVPAGILLNGGTGSAVIEIHGATPGVGTYPLFQYGAGLSGTGFSAFALGGLPSRVVAHLENNTVNNSLDLVVTASGEFPVWTGELSSEWSTAALANPKNWVLNSNSSVKTDFLAGDAVAFRDSAITTIVDISVAPVSPSAVKFDNATKDYTVTGSKGIAGNGAFTKDGAASVTLSTNNTYTGTTAINAGTLRVGSGGASGSLGTGAVTNSASLVFNRSDDFTVANVIGGTGLLTKEGAGVLSLSGASTYEGETHATAGAIRVFVSGSLGLVPGGDAVVSPGAALDLSGASAANTVNFGQKEFVVSGSGPAGHGALTNGGTNNQQNAFQRVTLQADSTFGGTGRFDLRAPQVGGVNQAKLDLAGHTLTKVDANQVTLVAVDVSAGNIVVNGGAFSMESTSTIPVNGSDTITFNSGTRALFFQNTTEPPLITRPFVFNGADSLIANGSAAASFVGSNILLNGDIALTTTASNLNPGALTLSGNITETGSAHGVTKSGNCVINLTGTSTYTGPTTITTGTLNVNGSLGATPVAIAAASTLGGTGTIAGTVAANGRLAPGNGIGTLTTGAVTFSPTGVLAAEINSDTLASDVLVVNGAVNLGGGALNLTDLGTTVLTIGAKITVARYTGSVSGAFSNVVDDAILPVGVNYFRVNYNDTDLGQPAITLTASPASVYEEWALEMHLDGSNKGKTQDPDGDGLTNFEEFAFGGDPLVFESGKKVRGGMAMVGADNALTLTVSVRAGATFVPGGDLVSNPIDGLIYMIQGSSDLVDLTTMNITEITPALSAGMPDLPVSGKWVYRSFRTPGTPGNPNPKAFLRLKVTEPAP